jgi:hypothetical protein
MQTAAGPHGWLGLFHFLRVRTITFATVAAD